MRVTILPLALIAALAAASACQDDRQTTFTAPVLESASSIAANGQNAAVPLSGDEEVPATATRARGTAIFHLSADGSALNYKLIVANIENVVQAHIHIEAAGVNGPIGVFLFGPVAPDGGRANGPIAEGTLTAADFIGPLAGMSMAALIAQMQAGNAYVNVHTDDGLDPGNTGPGDFPGGEVRGQIR
jgi:CHRD domain